MSDSHVALVTGGGQGIGEAICQQLAQAEVSVIVTGRDLEKCEAVAGRIGARATAVRLDVTDREAIRTALERALRFAEGLGPIDWLVNNAGMARSGPLLQTREVTDLYEEHMQVNFHGARRMVEALLPGMRERGYGRIVNIASSAGLYGYAYVSAYCASKHALVGYTRAAALELAQSGVTMSAVCPHYVDSPMTDRSVERIAQKTGRGSGEARELLATQNPGGRLVTPGEVADAAWELLAGDENGAIVELDGSSGS
jgi:NAD(P)-dependent dehydrogenase (short-subunit alcohol dehydrogenase family)